MKQLPTAETVLDDVWRKVHKQNPNSFWTTSAEQAMIEFAKLHVQQALESVSDLAKIDFLDGLGGEGTKEVGISKQSILNAYLLENIK